MSHFSARLLAAALIAWLAGPLPAQTLTHAVPGAVAPGKTTEIALHGSKLSPASRLWTSFPAQIENTTDPKAKDPLQLTFKLTLAPGVAAGIGGIVLASPSGQTDVLYVMIDDLPSLAESGDNHAADTPQDVPLPAAIDGACEGTLADYYRFSAKAGQRVSCEVVASRLGWDCDPVVRVLDAGGGELLRIDDDASSGADPRFVFTAPADGQYVLEVNDNRYKPGGRYRLRLGDFPLVSTPLPLVVSAGAATSIAFAGPQVEEVRPLTILAPLAGRGHSLPLSVRGPGSQASGWLAVGATDLPVVIESTSPTPASFPGAVTGALLQAGEQDLYTFRAAKGAAISFRAISKSAGSAAIVRLRVLNAAGNQVAESPVTDSDEPVLSFKPPEDGQYQLAVVELAGRGGVDYTYAVEGRSGPHFTLALKSDKNNRLKYTPADGGALYLDVQCQRAGYDGPVRLAVDSPRLGWQLFNTVIPAKANEGRLYIACPIDWSESEIAPLRIIGSAEIGGMEVAATMATTVQLRAARPQTPYPPAWHDGTIFVAGTGKKPAFYSVSAKRSEVDFPRQVGQAKLTLDFARLDEKFKDAPLTVLPLGLPAGVTAEVKRNGNGPKETYDLTFKGPKDLPEGEHAVKYFAYAEYANAGRAVLGDIRLNVVTPLAVAAAPAGPLVQGQKQKVKLSLTRRGDDKQPVEVRFKALPAGVSGPDKTTLAADQNELEIELSAAADAVVTFDSQFIVVATSKYAGTDITAESPAAVLEVRAP
jgi:hypothetical protein